MVAIDPAVSNNEGSDLTAIVVAGLAENGHVFVLSEQAGRWSPEEWARRAADAYRLWKADRIIGETNNGGALVESVLPSTQTNLPFKSIHASRGKVLRAEPVAAMFEQGRVHLVGNFPELEDQLTSFTSDFDKKRAGYSPDRVDAMVYAVTELAVTPGCEFATYPLFGEIPHQHLVEQFPPEVLAARGLYHPNDRQHWIARGVISPEGKPTT